MPMVVTQGAVCACPEVTATVHDPASLRRVREGEAVREEFTMTSTTTRERRPKITLLTYSNPSMLAQHWFEELTRLVPTN